MATWSELKFKLIATGDETGTWGETTNANLGTAIEQAITGATDITFADDNVTLTLTDTTDLQQGRALKLNLTGVVLSSKYLQVPDIQKFYIISNELTENIVVKNTTGSTYTIPAGTTAQVFSAGTGIENALTFFSGAILSPAAIIGGGTIDDTAIGLTTPNTGAFTTLESTSLETTSVDTTTITGLTTPLSVGQGGTGVALSTGTTKVVLSDSPTLTGSPLAPTQTAGDNSTKIATTAYVATAVTNATGSLGTMATQNANSVNISGGTVASTRINPRSLTLASTSGTITPDSDAYDQVNYSLTGTSTFVQPSGTPVNGQKLSIRIYAASAQSFGTWPAAYRAIGTILPTSIAAGKTIYMGCIYNSTDLVWDVVAVATQV